MRPRRDAGGTACADRAEQRSALVDGALGPQRRERLLAHLVHCTPCREDVVELRRLREALRGPAAAPTPDELARRLVSIAGPEAGRPLWTRPFRRTRPGSLTSPRRALRLRRTATAAAVGATVAGLGLVGYLSAPSSALPVVPDPGSRARVEFTAVLAQQPLGSDALGAVLAARPADLTATAPVPAAFPVRPGERDLGAAQARRTLARAAAAATTVSYSGRQTVQARSRGATLSATVQLDAVAGIGTRSQVLAAGGGRVADSFAPAASSTRLVEADRTALLARHYALAAWSGAEAAGRAATVVEARQGEEVAGRWWVDDASGVVLAQQSFDRRGRQVAQVGFTSVQIAGPQAPQLPRAASPVAAGTDVVLTLAAAPELDARGWTCPDELAGLALVRLRTTSTSAPTTVHLVYSDGLSTLSVFETRGRLAAGPRGASWDAALRAYVQEGASRLATWQSGDTVITVVTDGPAELLGDAVAALPHVAAPEPTTMERIRAGWASILADLKG